MGVLSASMFTMCILVVAFVTIAFCGWVLLFVYKSAAIVVGRQRQRQSKYQGPTNDVLCPYLFKRFSTVEFTMGISVICVAMFVVSAALQFINMVIMLITCMDCGKGERPAFQLWLLPVWVLCFTLGYALMFVTHFERLRLTFRNTQHRLPQWAPNCLYGVVLFGIVDAAIVCVLFHIEPIACVVLWVLLIAVYFASVSALIGTFFKKSTEIGAAHSDEMLTNTAVRVTVSVSMSLASTTLFGVLMLIWLMVCPFCLIWTLAVNVMLAFDMCFNAFCLMCTFRRAEDYYHSAFGAAHNWLLRRVTADGIKDRMQEMVAAATPVACETAQNTCDIYIE